ncbi:MAG: hypothetical protein WCV43_02765 [Candidatus Caldatribacteriota bacterium]|jgi:di/tricarboxylate transporter|nr:hypothetical protein [Atribacterota bacterium]MDD3031585.1 hypothetical protein [Atribacterota bacterium]MDD3641398.1 hypothetical protein [Atribacterota bacterium]MDD4288019.1 hypothetical protein [Atribacterota bacterium]MDD4764885.1 hypothetical protein [Atribacterota bacterium]
MTNEVIMLLLIIVFIIAVISSFTVRMMKTDDKKYRIPIAYSRILLGFLLAMLIYIIYLMLKGEDVIGRFLG